MKRNNLIFVLLALMILGIPGYVTPQAIKIKKVVIDAGHGGDDPGAVGKKAREKDITLSVALKIGNYIKTAFPDIEIIYTRKTDVFVELYKRAKIANDHKADLFISIHCNASKSTEPVGTESWVMGLHKSQANLEVAKKENAAILYENDYSVRYDGFDPNSPEANIIFGAVINEDMKDEVRVTVIATGFNEEEKVAPKPKEISNITKVPTARPIVTPPEDEIDIPAFLRKHKK